MSGTLASCVNIPFDVAKSRIQGPQPQKDVIKYRTTLGSVAIVYKEEGCVLCSILYKVLGANYFVINVALFIECNKTLFTTITYSFL